MNQSNELLFDADVLIDYCEVDRTIIRLISERIARAHVATPVLGEVTALNKTRCAALKLQVDQPTTEELLAAGALNEPISFKDKICLVLSRERGWMCVSNDRKLISCCETHGVATLRGLGLLLELVRVGAMTKRRAGTLANKIGEVNPSHIGEPVLVVFHKKLRGLSPVVVGRQYRREGSALIR